MSGWSGFPQYGVDVLAIVHAHALAAYRAHTPRAWPQHRPLGHTSLWMCWLSAAHLSHVERDGNQMIHAMKPRTVRNSGHPVADGALSTC
jgi:hypothetical protein